MSDFPLFAGSKTIVLLLHKKLICPGCSGTNLSILEYGYGSRGGCIVSSQSPQVICEYCNTRSYTTRDIITIYEKFSLEQQELTDEYLLEEIILPTNPGVSRIVQMLAIDYLKKEKSLLQVRLLKSMEYQKITKKKLEQIRSEA